MSSDEPNRKRKPSKKLLGFVVVAVLLLAVGLAVVIAGVGLLWKHLGPMAIPIVLVLLALAAWGIKILARRLMDWLLHMPFRMKGRALRGAKAVVHSVEVTRVDGRGRSVLIEATITPGNGPSGNFTVWELGEVGLVPKGTNAMDPNCETRIAIEELDFWEDGKFTKDEGFKLPGEQRLRFRVTIPGDIEDYRFHYYFEHFGEVRIPTSATRVEGYPFAAKGPDRPASPPTHHP